MNSLPLDIVTEILSYVTQPLDIRAFRLGCKAFNNLVYECLTVVTDPSLISIPRIPGSPIHGYKKLKPKYTEIKCSMGDCDKIIFKDRFLCDEHLKEYGGDIFINRYTRGEESFIVYRHRESSEGQNYDPEFVLNELWRRDYYGYMIYCSKIRISGYMDNIKKKGYPYIPLEDPHEYEIEQLSCEYVEPLSNSNISVICCTSISLIGGYNPRSNGYKYCSQHKDCKEVKGRGTYQVIEYDLRYGGEIPEIVSDARFTFYTFIEGELKDFIIVSIGDEICCVGHRYIDSVEKEKELINKHGLKLLS